MFYPGNFTRRKKEIQKPKFVRIDGRAIEKQKPADMGGLEPVR